MEKYDYSFKLAAVKAYLNGDVTDKLKLTVWGFGCTYLA